MQWGVAGCRVGLRCAWSSGWNAALGVGRAGLRGRRTETRLVLLYLAGGNDGLNMVLPNGNGEHARADELCRLQSNARKDHRPHVRGHRHGRQGRLLRRCPASPTRASWRSPTRRSPRPTAATTATANYGFDTLYGDGLGGVGSNMAVMPSVDALKYNLSHFDNSDIWFEGQLQPQQQDGLARSLDRRTAQRHEPAAGDLDRQRAVEVDPYSDQPGVRDRQPAGERLPREPRRPAHRAAGGQHRRQRARGTRSPGSSGRCRRSLPCRPFAQDLRARLQHRPRRSTATAICPPIRPATPPPHSARACGRRRT